MGANTSENTTRVIFTINKELKSKLEKLAKQDNRSLSNYVVNLLENYVKNNT